MAAIPTSLFRTCHVPCPFTRTGLQLKRSKNVTRYKINILIIVMFEVLIIGRNPGVAENLPEV
jgi:hypothetical protein